jgi:hypothetical protein
MKKPSRRDHFGEFSHGSQRQGRPGAGSEGRWEFNLASESLFALGSIDSVRLAAYRTAAGELRFLPL